MDYHKYKSSLKHYLKAKGFNVSNNPMFCFSPNHSNTNDPACLIYDEKFECKSCGIHGDIYDACGILTGITDKAEQFKEVEKTLGGYTPPPENKKPKFELDKNSLQKVLLYARDHAGRKKGVAAFLKQRGYEKEVALKMYNRLGYWPGYDIALKELGRDILKKAGIPGKHPDKCYSSWDHSGVICNLGTGIKLCYYNNDKCEKRGSKTCNTFPMPGKLPEDENSTIILVEAELSAISMCACGFENVYATGGTNGMSKEKCKPLLKYKRILLALDGDNAGRYSSGLDEYFIDKEGKKTQPENIIKKLLKIGYEGKILSAELPEKKDPDDLIRENKIDELKKIIDNAIIYGEEKKKKDPLEEIKIKKNELPFIPLGFDDKAYYVMPNDQNILIRISRGKKSIQNWMEEIADFKWWFDKFSEEDEEGNKKFYQTEAIEWFRTECKKKGLFDDEEVYGFGVHYDNGNYVFNAGDCLFINNKRIEYFEYDSKKIYFRSKRISRFNSKPWTTDNGVNLLKQLNTFKFEKPIEYIAIAGYMALAPFASILNYRPHIWITAKKGQGKTTLIKIIRKALGKSSAMYVDNNPTEASIRQATGKDCVGILHDEAEAKTKSEKISLTGILNLARSAYSGEKISRGTPDHRVVYFYVKNMFCFGSINVTIDNDGDRSRIVICNMKDKTDKNFFEPIKDYSGMRSRIFARIDKLRDYIIEAEKVIIKQGYDSRTSNTYAPFIVGFWMLISDNDFFDGDEKIQRYIIRAIEGIQTNDIRTDEERIIERILQERIKINPSNELTISEMLNPKNTDGSEDHSSGYDYDPILRRYGIRKCDYKGEKVLAINYDHPAITGILKDTPFSSYKEILRRHDFVIEKSAPIYMAGKNDRCILLDWQKLEEKYFLSEEEPY